MDTTYRPSLHYVAGDPYHVLAALAISTTTDRDDRPPKRRRRTKRNPFARS